MAEIEKKQKSWTFEEKVDYLSKSTVIPDIYKGNKGNCGIALELAQRIGVSPLMVMQNMHIIHGKPSWSSTFIIAMLNSCGRFSPLRFEYKEKEYCMAVATDLATGELLEGPKITPQMVKGEKWDDPKSSKWKTMPQLMMRYRAAAFFGRLYAPDLLMGMHSEYEIQDAEVSNVNHVQALLTPTDQSRSDDSSSLDQNPEMTE